MILSCRILLMKMPFRRASHLIATSAFIVIIPALASASDVERDARVRLAMGPMSAAQKNQNQGTVTKSDAAQIKPHHRTRHRRTHHGG